MQTRHTRIAVGELIPVMPGSGLPSDDDLLVAAAAGDRTAFAAFYRRWEAPVLAFFVRRVRDPELAADLAGETFASALAACPRYRRGDGSAAGWIFAIAGRRLSDSLRRGRVQDRARRRLGMEPVGMSDEAIERIERLTGDAWAAAMLEGLPAEQREAVLARIVEEREYGEIAARLRCSESVVRQRVSRGLRSLREQIGEREHVDPA